MSEHLPAETSDELSPAELEKIHRDAGLVVTANCIAKQSARIAELERKLKCYEPVNTYNGLTIEQWKERAERAESRCVAKDNRIDDDTDTINGMLERRASSEPLAIPESVPNDQLDIMIRCQDKGSRLQLALMELECYRKFVRDAQPRETRDVPLCDCPPEKIHDLCSNRICPRRWNASNTGEK